MGAKGLGRFGMCGATRVYEPDVTPILCRDAAAAGIPGFYGSTPEVLGEPGQLLAPPKAA
jgi:hypothetical protein